MCACPNTVNQPTHELTLTLNRVQHSTKELTITPLLTPALTYRLLEGGTLIPLCPYTLIPFYHLSPA